MNLTTDNILDITIQVVLTSLNTLGNHSWKQFHSATVVSFLLCVLSLAAHVVILPESCIFYLCLFLTGMLHICEELSSLLHCIFQAPETSINNNLYLFYEIFLRSF